MRTPAWQLWFLAGSAVFSLGGQCTANTYGELNQAQFLPLHPECEPSGYEYAVPKYAAGGAEDDITVSMITHGCSHATYQTIRSTHPEVATLTAIADGVHIKTGIAGTTDLQLLDDHGQLVDTTPIVVSDIVRYEGPYGGVVAENVPILVAYIAHDNTVAPLVDTNATQKTVSGSLTIISPDQPACAPFKLVGSAGMGTVQVGNGTVSTQMGVEVVSLDKVASINLFVGTVTDHSRVTVSARARLADGRGVDGANCQWTAADPAVTLQRTDPDPQVVYFDSEMKYSDDYPRSSAEFQLGHRGSFVVTCTIGATSASATINW